MKQPAGFADNYDEQQTAAFLAALLYRANCPSAETLLDYGLGLLAPARQPEVYAHLATCPHCTAEVHDLAQIEGAAESGAVEQSPAAEWLDRLRTLFPDRPVLDALFQPPTAPALALRGESTETRPEQQLIYRADTYRLSISIAPPGPNSISHQVEGSVIDEQDPAHALSGRVHLLQDETPVQQVDIDEFGYFSLSNIPPEQYTLLVELPRHSLWIQTLSVP